MDGSVISEPTEVEYLKKVLYEYMMGKETKVWCNDQMHNDKL